MEQQSSFKEICTQLTIALFFFVMVLYFTSASYTRQKICIEGKIYYLIKKNLFQYVGLLPKKDMYGNIARCAHYDGKDILRYKEGINEEQ